MNDMDTALEPASTSSTGLVQHRDPAPLRPTPRRVGPDFWPTPPCLAAALVSVLDHDPAALAGSALGLHEPAGGDGRLVDVLRQAGHDVSAADLHPLRQDIARTDFLLDPLPRPARGRMVVTNPPFSLMDAFIERGLGYVRSGEAGGLALLLRQDHVFAASRVHWMREAASIHACAWRPRWVRDSAGNPRWAFSWVIWSPAAAERGKVWFRSRAA